MDPKITRRAVAELTAKAFDTNLKELCSCSRNRAHTKARFAVWYLIKEFRPETSLKELGNMLDKDHTTVINGLIRAKEFSELNRDFADRIHRARRMIAQWRSGESLVGERVSSLVPVAKKIEPVPTAYIGAKKPSAFSPEFRMGFEYDAWVRESCKTSEQRFLALAMQEFPHLVRVPVKEAVK